ncbi:MAG: O-antigen ligase family protein [Patescibacteria group bacterium]|nr:O-antigen ligase family protein [Patescibacteria group bacterium]
MSFFLYFIFFLFSFGQLGRITLFERQINFYIYEIFLLFFIFALFLKFKFKPIIYFFKNEKKFFLLPLFLFISYLINFYRFNYFQNLIAFLYLLRITFYLLYFLYIFYWTKEEKKNKKIIANSLKIFYFLTIITTITQYFLYPNLRNLMYLGWDPHLERAFGVFFDTSIAGAVFGLIFFNEKNIFLKIIFALFLILTYSRAIILSFFIALFYVFFSNKKSFFIFLTILLLMIGFLILIPKPEGEGAKLTRTYTIVSRVKDYQEAINLFFKKPVFGFGYNHLRYVRGIENSNAGSNFSSSYLTILATSGIIGLLGFIAFIKIIWKKYEVKRTLLIFIFIASFFDNIFLHPFVLFLFFSSLFDR